MGWGLAPDSTLDLTDAQRSTLTARFAEILK